MDYIFCDDRPFVLLDYMYGHNRLLIRGITLISDKPGEEKYENIDLMFGYDITYLEMTKEISGIKIRYANDKEKKYLRQRMSCDEKDEDRYLKYYVLESYNGDKFYIVAGGLAIFKNNYSLVTTATIYVKDEEDGLIMPDFESYGELLFEEANDFVDY